VTAPQAPLPPRAARTFYNVVDALLPPGPEGDVDLAPAAAEILAARGRAASRRAVRILRAIEWQPRLTLRGRRGFSWLSREERQRLLERWSGSRLAGWRAALAEIEGLVRAARGHSSLPGA
jgi:hypothetical protein